MIGSRRKIAQVCDTFLNNGWATIEQWEKIHTPIGLEIGSKTVQEIAVSIAAQLIQVRNEIKKG
ncbi:MAG: XdhC family protein [Draconibacterium sp.]|nr:XdhC family protein [Draconibacterium sp.]